MQDRERSTNDMAMEFLKSLSKTHQQLATKASSRMGCIRAEERSIVLLILFASLNGTKVK